jgi:hypothetical protein
MRFTGLDTSKYEGSSGIELIAKDLGIPYPVKGKGGACQLADADPAGWDVIATCAARRLSRQSNVSCPPPPGGVARGRKATLLGA